MNKKKIQKILAPLCVHLRDADPMGDVARRKWLKSETKQVRDKIRAKFLRGQVEHQSEFGEQGIEYLLEAIEEEAIDTIMYVRELKRRVKQRKLI